MGEEQIKKEVFVPGKISEYVLSAILVIVLLIGLLTFPFGQLMKGTDMEELSFKVGIPWTFFELSFGDTSKMPIRFLGLIGDLLIYLLIAYFIDIFVSLMGWNIAKSKEAFERDKKQKEIYERGKIAYDYYKKQNLPEEKIIEMFKKKGWQDTDLKKIIAEKKEIKIDDKQPKKL